MSHLSAGSRAPADAVPVVVVTNDGPSERVRRCIGSVEAAPGAIRPGPIIVVDNSGRAGSPADYGTRVGEVVRVPNRGYGAAANAGLSRAAGGGAPMVALLNDDTEATDGWLDPLVDSLHRTRSLGAVQPKLVLDPSGLVNSLGVEVDDSFSGTDIGFGEPDGGSLADREIRAFTGGAVLFRSEFLSATGGFDETYFLYYEDVDLSLRGGSLGWSYLCVPRSVVRHRQGATTDRLGNRRRYLQERNRLRVAVRFGTVHQVAQAFWLSVRRLRHRPWGTHARALVAGLGYVPITLAARTRAR